AVTASETRICGCFFHCRYCFSPGVCFLPCSFFFFKQKTAYDIGLGIPAEPLFRSLKFMRASIKMIGVSNLQSFIASMTQKLTLSDISDESKNYLDKAGITTACLRIKSKWTAGGK